MQYPGDTVKDKFSGTILFLFLSSIAWGQTSWVESDASGLSLTPVAKSIFKVVKTPNPLASNDILDAVAASSGNDIWAVGDTAIHFDGTKWTGFPTAPIDNQGNTTPLNAVAVLSPTNAWAVGSVNDNGQILGSIEHWDGTKWSLVPGPFAAQSDPLLFGITAISSKDIWVVGSIIVQSVIEPLFVHYNGKVWKQVPGPVIGAQGLTLMQSVSALATNDVYAVGWSGFENDNSRTFVEHWNGKKWSVVPSPSVGAGANQLNSVVALAPNDVWGSGFSVAVAPPASAPQQTLIEHWDGTSWKVVASPNTGHGQFQSNRLFGIIANTATDLWAFGSAFKPDGSGQQLTLLLHWNGTKWTIAPSPNPKASNFLDDLLFGGVVTAPGSIWIVGTQDEAPMPFSGTLVLHTTGG